MACLPQSGGCERLRIDPFVALLNSEEGTGFAHDECLDLAHRNSCQPEVSYIDSGANKMLVIERKTLAWPVDYVRRHKNDHFVASGILHGLRDFTSGQRSYLITLPPRLGGTRDELEAFIGYVVASARRQLPGLQMGQAVEGEHDGLRWWFAVADAESRRELGVPSGGVAIQWATSFDDDVVVSVPGGMSTELVRLFDSCLQKFLPYLDARRILLIEPQGDIERLPDTWWVRLLEAAPPPAEIDEVWITEYGWVTDFDQPWTFTRVDPPSAP